MRLIDAAKAALELLEYGNEIDAITALRAAIEAAEKQEPVAWMGEYNINDIRDHYTVVMRHKTDFSSMPDRVRPLYTTPQPAIPAGFVEAFDCGKQSVQVMFDTPDAAAKFKAMLAAAPKPENSHD